MNGSANKTLLYIFVPVFAALLLGGILVVVLQDPPPPADVEGPVVTTSTGLKYQDLREGTGAEAKPGKEVVVHYRGRFKDGTQFESSYDTGRKLPFRIGSGAVIIGWDEGIAGMKVGGKRRLVVPPDLAYGEKGKPPVIPANAELTFEIELFDVR